MKKTLAIAAAAFIALNVMTEAPASAEPGKEFTTSVIYGTLAGTLVGAATLAFTSNPGDNLNNVARGASYGLYAGILLGLYVAYGVSDDTQQPVEENHPDQQIYEGSPPPVAPDKPQGNLKKDGAVIAVAPIAPSLTGRAGDWGIEASVLNIHF